jgi:hypothetical protein
MTYKIKMTRVYSTYFLIEADTEQDALEQFYDIPDEDKYNAELEQMNVDEDVIVLSVTN